MSFPNFPDKHSAESVLRAEDIVAYRNRLGRGLDFTPDGALLCLERGLPHRMRWKIPVRKAGSMNADVFQVRKSNIAVLTSFGGGAPMVAELAEELIVMGAKRMVLMTWGGILQRDIEPGDIFVCSRAIRDEGTSHHYLPPEKYASSDGVLADEIARAIRARGGLCEIGTTWTTDAPYRETREEILQYQSEGVRVVELESAGLFTVGLVRQVPTVSVVVGMDSLATLEWKTPERLDGIMRSLETVYLAAIDVLSKPC